MKKTILSLNCGSSSLKYNLFLVNDDNTVEPVINGVVEEIGNLERSTMKFELNGTKKKYEMPFANHEDALKDMFKIFEDHNMKKESIVAVGHRVVHGGSVYKESILIDEHVKSTIEELSPVAPLHNPVNLQGILVAEKLLPGVPNIAVFDTAFHGDIEQPAFRYAIPDKWYNDYMVRRYGFHGTSHLYVSRRAAKILNIPYNKFNCITAHLGNGSSIAKVNNGKSCDTSMGFTPLEGVIMGTRSGDLDPAIIGHVAKNIAKDEDMELGDAYEKVMNMLNKDCGLKAIGGTNLMQDIRAKALEGDEFSENIVNIYAYRIAKYIGSYMATSDGCNAIIFTAGVGENEWYVRQKTLEYLKGFNFVIDDEKNKIRGEEIQFATGTYNGSEVKVFVLPTDEEVVIAYDSLYIGYLHKQAPDVYPFEQ
ncbi:MAG: acetate kinase [Clostridiales bacterium]|nr:acetate kinase [Clostridiales bacterium]